MHTVAIQRVDTYDQDQLRTAMERLLAPLGGMAAFVSPGQRVLLKPNLLAGKPPEAAVTTHPAIVRVVIQLVQAAGGTVLVGDSPGIGSQRRVAEKCGILAVIEETGAQLVEFGEVQEVAAPGLFKRFAIAAPYLAADRVINLPKLKTHEMMTLTCAVKNLFGVVVGTEKATWHLKAGSDRELFARMLLELALVRLPDLTIVDAVVGMEGDGPNSGQPRQIGALLAGVNPVAVDVIAAELVGMPKKLLWLERAAERLDVAGWDRATIEIVGELLDDLRVRDFRLPHLSDVQFGLPRFLKNRLRHYLTSRPEPLPEGCQLCGICRDACPPHAIEIRDGRLRIDYHRCIRCFCCRELCPTGSLGVAEGAGLKLIKRFL